MVSGISTGGSNQATVTAEVFSSAIIITNQTTATICYAVHESSALARIEWGPVCTDGNRILPTRSARLPFSPGTYAPSGEAVVSWWYQNREVVEGHIRLKII